MDRDTKVAGGWRGRLKSLWSRVPLASIVAFNMCVVGILVFSICLYLALKFVINVFNLTIIGKVVWLVMILHLLMCLCFLLLGTLSSGDTRKQVYDKMYHRCKGMDFLGRGAHIAAMGTAYFWHFFWLMVPVIFLVPVVLVMGLNVGCQYIPDCVTLSDIGIPISITQKITSEEWVNYARDYNITALGTYVDQAENTVNDLLDKVEDSGMIDKVVDTIDRIIPDKTKIDELKAKFAEKVEAVNVERYLVIIEETVNKTMDVVVRESSKIGDLADKIGDWDLGEYLGNGTFSGMLENIEIPNLSDILANASVKTVKQIRDQMYHILNSTILFEQGEIGVFVDNFDSVLKKNVPGFDESDPNKTFAEDGIRRAKNIEKAGQSIENEILKRATAKVETVDGDTDEEADLINSVTRAAVRAVNRVDKLTEDIATAVMDAWMENTGQVTDEIINGLVKDAELAAQQAQAKADKAVAKAETAAKTADAAEEQVLEESDEQVKQAAEEAAKKAREIAEKTRQIADNAEKKAQEAQDMAKEMFKSAESGAHEMVMKSAAKMHQLGKELDDEVDKGLRQIHDNTEKFVQDITAEAEVIAQKTEEAAEKALAAATDAVKKAEQASKDALNKLDDIARDLARKTEEKVKQAARLVKKYTRIALIKVRQAIAWLKRSLINLANKAGDFALQLSERVRRYASEAIIWARKASREVARYARMALNYATIGQSEAMKGYEVAKSYVKRLGITQEGDDTFCSSTKRMVCDELHKASVCFILVFIAAIVLNLGMLHWLMVLAANYVHVKKEAGKRKKENKERGRVYRGNITEGGKRLPYKQSEAGSLSLLSDA